MKKDKNQTLKDFLNQVKVDYQKGTNFTTAIITVHWKGYLYKEAIERTNFKKELQTLGLMITQVLVNEV